MTYTAKNDQVVAILMKTGLNNVSLPTLFTVVNNIEEYCYTRFRLNSIVQCCWQVWTTWAAKHCSILLNSGLSIFTCVGQDRTLPNISPYSHTPNKGSQLYNINIKIQLATVNIINTMYNCNTASGKCEILLFPIHFNKLAFESKRSWGHQSKVSCKILHTIDFYTQKNLAR
jgi:hypothetical protein